MIHSRKILCLLLAGIMMFSTACGGGNGSGVTYDDGRFVEFDITPPVEGRFSSYLSDGGNIVCFDAGLRNRFESADGGANWSVSPGPGRNTDRYFSVQGGALLPDGSLLVYMQGEGLEIVAPDGSSKPYPVVDIDKAIANGENVFVSQLQATGDRVLISFTAGGMASQSVRQGGPVGGSVTTEGPQTGPPRTTSGEAPPDDPDAPPDDPDAPFIESSHAPPGGPSGSSTGGGTFMSMRPVTLLCDLGTGQIIAEIHSDTIMASAFDEAALYIMDVAGNVSTFSASDGKPSGKPDVKLGGESTGAGAMHMRIGASEGFVLTPDGKGGFYAAYDGDLMIVGDDGEISTVLESTAYSIGAPRSAIDSFFILGDGSIVVNLLSNNQSNRLYKYVWDKDATVDPDKTITVWSLEDNSFVRAAIAELRKKYPDSYIKYEVAMDGSSAVSAADAIRTLNTRLLGGSGPDVLILDGCSAESYTDRGMLMDMSMLIDTGGVYDSLLKPYTHDGKLYCLPAQFRMPLLIGSAEALEKARTLSDLIALAVSGNDMPIMSPQGPGPMTGVDEEQRAELYFDDLKELSDILWATGAPGIISDNRLDTEELRKYLEAVKAISDKYALADETPAGGRMGMGVAFSDGSTVTAFPGSLTRYTMRMTNYAAFSASSLQLLQMLMDRDDSAIKPFPGLTAGTWQPSTIVGISADTKTPDFAAELIQTMLSLDVQRHNYGTGLPVTREGIAAQIEAIDAVHKQFGITAFEFDAEALIGALRTPSMVDTVLTSMMWNSVEKLCKGEIDVEGAVREIEQSIKNYLAERA